MLTRRAGFRVEAIDPERSLVLAAPEDATVIPSVFELCPVGSNETRLVNRLRCYFPPGIRSQLFALLFDVGDFVMMPKMLLGIKERAEDAAQREGRSRLPEAIA